MTISWLQAALLGLFASLASMPGMGGSSIGNYTLGRPLVGGLVSGLILGDIKTGIMVGVALQVLYIALVTPGGTVSADVRAISYIGIPLAILFVHSKGITGEAAIAAAAAPIGAAVGTIGTVLFYGTATTNLLWQHIGWKAVEKGEFKKLYAVDWVYPWISHFVFSFLPTMIITKFGPNMVELMKEHLPMDGFIMKALFTVGALLPCVGIAILLKQIVTKAADFIPFFVGFTLAKSLGLNLVASAVVSLIFAVIYYELEVIKSARLTAPAGGGEFDDDEEDI
ncbi:PTS mannose/fructose/sorbose/N-acetylgalactosamine transporter subunit IIC [Streptococcus panodentis]|uniref:PTS sorbose transporter subunit IIC n=1 Tax=Streptococcus panodentis TaxID=1581472 RepID=A0ABS5AVN1_9STRE|nr:MULTISPECIES: PTS sugar transporter subunit IIC [Streptococcus]KXT83309.1 PTS system, fructose- and mannose-inducible IIC component [Streptococcus sp. DD11]MBP2620535.1 PTS sorbose transporter subunit IIC [Streptococcus panodentis]